jgi:hypothetical protein
MIRHIVEKKNGLHPYLKVVFSSLVSPVYAQSSCSAKSCSLAFYSSPFLCFICYVLRWKERWRVAGSFSFLYRKINSWIPVGALSDSVEQLQVFRDEKPIFYKKTTEYTHLGSKNNWLFYCRRKCSFTSSSLNNRRMNWHGGITTVVLGIQYKDKSIADL